MSVLFNQNYFILFQNTFFRGIYLKLLDSKDITFSHSIIYIVSFYWEHSNWLLICS